MTHLNPYIAGNPIDDRSVFFGRQDIFREVMQVLRHPQSNAIVLYGQRRIGKTSVLLQLKHQLAEEGNFTPVYFDLQDKASKPLGQVLFELAQRIAIETKQKLPNQENFDSSGVYFQKTFLPEITEKIGVGSLVLLFDEFDVLDSPVRGAAGQDFFPYLRTWMTDLEGVQFVFVIGRRPEDLSVDTLSTFKAVRASRVSVLEQKEAEAIVRQSERSKSLAWTKGAIDKIWSWAHGHPYFTQLLCGVVWDHAYEESPSETPRVGVEEVDVAIKDALKRGANAFQWIWDGLPPAERVVSAAMAEAGNDVITQDQLAEVLRRSGVRLIVRELELAPDTLVEWEVLEPAEGGYRYMVPLLRRWVADNRPLRRVKDELDRLDPLAENLFQAGQGFYIQEQLTEAENQLRQALRINPNHLKSRLLLGRILLERKELTEAVDVLEEAYQYDSIAVRADLVKALLALAETKTENTQLAIFDKVLSIDKMQVVARDRRSAIWVRRGESELSQNNLDAAITAFQEAGDEERVKQTLQKKRESIIVPKLLEAEKYESGGKWEKAIEIYEATLKEYPDDERLIAGIKKARIGLASKYESDENWKKAASIFDEILENHPDDEAILERSKNSKIRATEIFETNGNWQAAVIAYRDLTQAYPNDEAVRNKYEKARRQFKDGGFQAAALYESEGNWNQALETYETLDFEYPDDDRIIDRLKNAKMQLADQQEMNKNWDKAVNIYESLILNHAGDKRIEARLESAKMQARLMNTYNQAIVALEGGDSKKAQRLLADVIYEQPDFEDAALYLFQVTKISNQQIVKIVSPPKITQSLLYWLLATIILGIIILIDSVSWSDGEFSMFIVIPVVTFVLSNFRPIKWWQILLYQGVIVLWATSILNMGAGFFFGFTIVYTFICSIIAHFSRKRIQKSQQFTVDKVSKQPVQITTNNETSRKNQKSPADSERKYNEEKLIRSTSDGNVVVKNVPEFEQTQPRTSFRGFLKRVTKPILIISSVLSVISLIIEFSFNGLGANIGISIESWFLISIFGYIFATAIFIIKKIIEFIRRLITNPNKN